MRLARAAESAGVAMLTVHGRTREQGYKGDAEYDTVARREGRGAHPGGRQRRHRLRRRRRATCSRDRRRRDHDRPRGAGPAVDLPRDRALPRHRRAPAAAAASPRSRRWLLEHLDDHYALYGEFTGVRSARKHIGWYVQRLPGGEAFRAAMNAIETCDEQLRAVDEFFDGLARRACDRMPPARRRRRRGRSDALNEDDEPA